MSLSIPLNNFLNSARGQEAITIASMVTGLGLTSTSLHQLFDNEVGTNTQILTIALPVIILLGRTLSIGHACLRQKKFSRQHPLVIPFLLGALYIMASHRMQRDLPIGICDYYSSCPNAEPHFVKECKQLYYQCEKELQEASWHLPWRFIAHSHGGDIWYLGGAASDSRNLVPWCADGSDEELRFETKKEAVGKLCSRIFEEESNFQRDEYSLCFRVNPESLQRVTHIRQEFYDKISCRPDLENNSHYQFVSRLSMSMLIAMVILSIWYINNTPLINDEATHFPN